MTWEELSINQQQEVERQMEVITRGAVEIVPEEEMKRKVIKSVAAGIPLKIKLGLDPSAPDIHVGHTIVIHKLRQLGARASGAAGYRRFYRTYR